MSEHRFSEVLIERPRGGLRRSSRRLSGTKKHLEQLTKIASEEGLLCPYLIKTRNKTKYLSDHLGPLRRFLRSNLGQPWDLVYSKLCRKVKTNTMQGKHVMDHVWGYVERHVVIIEGIPHRKPGGAYGGGFTPLTSRQHYFYVHPETGLLCAPPGYNGSYQRKRKRDLNSLDIMKNTLHKVNFWRVFFFGDG